VSWIFVYSSVRRMVLWPTIFDASMLDPLTSCHHVMLARRKGRPIQAEQAVMT
jgi:hypothetical protein